MFKKLDNFGLIIILTLASLVPVSAPAHASQIQNFSETFSTVGTNVFTVPSGVTQVTVELWGAGGAGGCGGSVNKAGGGGGAGGQYAKKIVTVAPNNSYNVVIGGGGIGTSGSSDGASGGDSVFGNNLVVAKGGAGGVWYGRGGAGGTGSTSGGIGDTIYAGGGGYKGALGYSGGGGGGAGSNGDGGSASMTGGGSGTANNGGNGGAGSTANSGNGANGSSYGGGGGGSTKNSTAGNGANGYAALSWSVVVHFLSYSAGTGGTISGVTSQTVNNGGSGTTVTAVPNTGYHFTQWSDGLTDNPRTETNVTGDKSVTAQFAVNVYTLSFSAGVGGYLSGTATQFISHGGDATAVRAVPNTGYYFVQWSDGITQAMRTDTNVTADKSVTAQFAVNVYTLTYSAGAGGTISGTSPQSVSHGSSGSAVTAVPNTGYMFTQWSDGLTDNPRTDTNVTGGKTLLAQFTSNVYTLTYSAGTGGTISGTSPQSVSYGGNGTAVTAVPNANYVFSQWSDGLTQNPRTDTNVTANKTVTAQFLPTYTITYSAGTGGTISGTSPQTVAQGGNCTAMTAVPNTGYTFTQWSDGRTDNPRTDTNVTANKTVTAQFTINTYTLTYSAGTGGTISGTSPQTVAHGSNGTAVTAVPNVSHNFSSWTGTHPSGSASRTDTNVQGNITVTANFTIKNYTLTYSAGTGGTVSGTSPQNVNHGSNGSAVTAVPSTGYTFTQWSDGLTQNPRTDTNVTANKTVTAQFTINTYTLSYSAGVGGSLSGTATQFVNHGSNGTPITAVPSLGYTFTQWSDGRTDNPRTDNNITGNNSLTAQFTANAYVLQYAAGPGGSLSGTTLQAVSHGNNGTQVTAVPNANYYFVKWSDDVTQNPRTDTNVMASKNVSAIFELIGSTRAKVLQTAEKFTIGSSNKGLALDLPLKSKYTKSSTPAGSELFTDRTPYGNDGQNFGAVSSAAQLTFDGVNDYVRIPISPALQAQTNLTMTAWVNPASPFSGDAIIIGQNAYQLMVASDWSARTTWTGKSSAGPHSSGAGTVSSGQWNFIAAVWDSGNVRIYVNGNLKNTVASTGTGNSAINQVWIGADSNGTSRAFKGGIANVRIYNAALSEVNIKALYDQGLDDSAFILRGQD